jgi:hypothetical protein
MYGFCFCLFYYVAFLHVPMLDETY